jgi:cellulose synthase/poly-beta-1,6-N-acetylglucosamine synthase-like glycosyltransferase
MKKILWVSMTLLGAALALFLASRELSRPNRPIEEIGGTEWAEVLSWDFADGAYPEGWGWGERRFVDGSLELVDDGLTNDDGVSVYAVYFLPVSHGSDFVLETEFQPLPRADEGDVGVHLITRDSGIQFNESGMVVYPKKRQGYFRHMVNRTDLIEDFADTGLDLESGVWHRLRLVLSKGRYSAYLNDREIFSRRARRGRAVYNETHLAVEGGAARFRSVRVLTAPGFRVTATERVPAPGAVPGELPGFVGTDGTEEAGAPRPWWIRLMLFGFYFVIFLVCVYMVRHYLFTLNRLFGRQRHPYVDVDAAVWPRITVLVPAHNEEPVIGAVLESLLEADYPHEKLRILAIDDRSKDETGRIVDEIARRHPSLVTPFHRTEGKAGKAAALEDAMKRVADDIVLVFDADYIPGKGLLKQLVAPFFDPEVGAVMGRVIPHNVETNLLTRALDLERSGGYQVDQQARMNLHLVPQFGGTVGGIRRRALESLGGWDTGSLTEDTDATFRLMLAGWKVVYQNRSECYEQVPESWPMRMRQLLRWARGHNQAMAKHSRHILFNKLTTFREKLDGLLLLHIYLMSVILLVGWSLGIVLWYLGVNKPGLIVILAVTSYSTLGNFAVFYEIAAAAYLDGSRQRLRLLPLILLGFLVSLVAVTHATVTLGLFRRGNSDLLWHKTEHTHPRPTWT